MDGCRCPAIRHGPSLTPSLIISKPVTIRSSPDVQDFVSWQIVPTALPKYLGGADKAGAQRAMQAMIGMVKLDIEGLKRAYEGKSAA